MTRLVAADIGGTHVRFAVATLGAGDAITLGDPVTLKTGDYVSLKHAWDHFVDRCDAPVPRYAALAVAGPITAGTVQMTNNSWTIRTDTLANELGLDRVIVFNDFAAVAHAAATLPDSAFLHLAGPDAPLPATGTISVIGPGTGLGVAHFHRYIGGYHVQATEGGHIDFAPVDHVDDLILARLRQRHRRVSAERVVSGPAIVDIHATLAAIAGHAIAEQDDKVIWQAGTARTDSLASTAVDRFCMALGSVAGDLALAHGAAGVVIAGGLGYRIRETLITSAFAERFRFKGRYEALMAGLPVKLITHPQPGLFGAAAAFAREYPAS